MKRDRHLLQQGLKRAETNLKILSKDEKLNKEKIERLKKLREEILSQLSGKEVVSEPKTKVEEKVSTDKPSEPKKVVSKKKKKTKSKKYENKMLKSE